MPFYISPHLGRNFVEFGLGFGDVGVDVFDLFLFLLLRLIVGLNFRLHVLDLKLQLGPFLDQVSQFLKAENGMIIID